MQNATRVLYIADIILAGQDEHDMASTLETLVRHEFQTVGNKPYEDSGNCHFSKALWDPLSKGMPWYLLQGKRLITASCILHHKEGSTVTGDLFGFWRQDILHLGILLQLWYWVTQKALSYGRHQVLLYVCLSHYC